MTDQTAVARPQQEVGLDLPTQQVINIARVGEVERIEQVVVLPAIYQYVIQRYGSAPRVMLTSDAYDYLNRAMGVQLYQPDWVHDERGQRVRNPIHRPDYIYLRLIGIWTNDIGQTVSYREDVEVDFRLVYHDARINSKSAHVEMGKDGEPKFSETGMPIVKLDAGDELKALKALSQLRTYGLRYAQTVAKTRILKTASGIRSIPGTAPRPFTVRVVGFRDKLTPDERVRRAEEDMKSIFGSGESLDEDAGLTDEEKVEMEAHLETGDLTEDLDRDLIESAEAADEMAERDIDIIEPIVEEAAPTDTRRVGPADFEPEPEGLGLDQTPPKA